MLFMNILDNIRTASLTCAFKEQDGRCWNDEKHAAAEALFCL